jgi:hypothetical protein
MAEEKIITKKEPVNTNKFTVKLDISVSTEGRTVEFEKGKTYVINNVKLIKILKEKGAI